MSRKRTPAFIGQPVCFYLVGLRWFGYVANISQYGVPTHAATQTAETSGKWILAPLVGRYHLISPGGKIPYQWAGWADENPLFTPQGVLKQSELLEHLSLQARFREWACSLAGFSMMERRMLSLIENNPGVPASDLVRRAHEELRKEAGADE